MVAGGGISGIDRQFEPAARWSPRLIETKPTERETSEELRCAALNALAHDERPWALAHLWYEAVAGRAKAYRDWVEGARIYVVARTVHPIAGIEAPLRAREIAVVTRVFCGDQQKAVAAELGIANSTTSKYFNDAQAKLGLAGRPIPIPFVLAAQAAHGRAEIPTAACSSFEFEGSRYLVTSVPKPRITAESTLTPSEQIVALHFLEGCTRREIALRRSRSQQTVACQLSIIYAKLGFTSRTSAIRKGVELGWFEGT